MPRTIDRTVLSDAEAKEALRAWPLRPGVQWSTPENGGGWLRALPANAASGGPARPAITIPGMYDGTSNPDGLWIAIGPESAFADLIVVEHCGTRQNFYDKRSRYMAATYARMLNCPLAWLLHTETINAGHIKHVWELLGIAAAPISDLVLPVRHLRVLYALNATDYEFFLLTPFGAHEFFCSHVTLRGWTSPAFQRFVEGLSADVHFFSTNV